jgi:hypothetical protein
MHGEVVLPCKCWEWGLRSDEDLGQEQKLLCVLFDLRDHNRDSGGGVA